VDNSFTYPLHLPLLVPRARTPRSATFLIRQIWKVSSPSHSGGGCKKFTSRQKCLDLPRRCYADHECYCNNQEAKRSRSADSKSQRKKAAKATYAAGSSGW
jgi:hypothetical protein